MLFEILAFGGLQIEPRVRERFNVGQQRLDERMEFVLRKTERVDYNVVRQRRVAS